MRCPDDVTGPHVGYDPASGRFECIVVMHGHADGVIHLEGAATVERADWQADGMDGPS